MPYIQSPMERFNKNNPFVIIAKKEYDLIIDKIHEWSKQFILQLTIQIISLLLFSIASVICFFIKGFDIYILFLIITNMILTYLMHYYYRRKIAFYMKEHEAIVEFDRLSSLEVNDILVLNNEDILKCTNRLYQAYGEIKQEKWYFSFGFYVIIMMQLVAFVNLCAIIISHFLPL